jgi:hypothetical protein
MRSDLLDHLSNHRKFLEMASSGLLLLPTPDRGSLVEAMVEPVHTMGYRFDDTRLVNQIVDEVEGRPGSLPLLQFFADQLWDRRDRERKLITTVSYRELGTISGALAQHADTVLASLPSHERSLARALFRRLVTAERTRNVVPRRELDALASADGSVSHVLDALVSARLLVVTETGAGQATVEIIHESLLTAWPTLLRWLDQDRDDAAFISELRTAAKQWNSKDRNPGLLWRGEAATEARFIRRRLTEPLSAVENEFLDAVEWQATRAARLRGLLLVTSIAVLAALVVIGGVGLLQIRKAEKAAVQQAQAAETARAELADKLDKLAAAKAEVKTAQSAEKLSRQELEQAYADLQSALAEAKAKSRQAAAESAKARDAEREARKASAKLKEKLDEERRRVKQLKAQRGKRADDDLK